MRRMIGIMLSVVIVFSIGGCGNTKNKTERKHRDLDTTTVEKMSNTEKSTTETEGATEQETTQTEDEQSQPATVITQSMETETTMQPVTTSSTEVRQTGIENVEIENNDGTQASQEYVSEQIVSEQQITQPATRQATTRQAETRQPTTRQPSTQQPVTSQSVARQTTAAITKRETQRPTQSPVVTQMNVNVNGRNFTVILEDNQAVKELIDLMRISPVVIQMNDYAGFEKVGALGRNLTTSNTQTTTNAGDIVLYSGNQIVMFYGSNSWSYTRIGHISDLTGWQEALGSGDVTATFSMG